MVKRTREEDKVRAEAQSRPAIDGLATRPKPLSATLSRKLKAIQRELEMQNECLREAQSALMEARDKYADLYDFAPVGYITLAKSGLISQINFTASVMLGVEQSTLIGRRVESMALFERG